MDKKVKKSLQKKKYRFKQTKIIALLMTATLLLGGVIGGTVAWLITKTDPVINTFTYGDINIKLEESDTGDGDGNPNTNEYEMIPGNSIVKDPKVTVLSGNEACWLFVKLEKTDNFNTFMEYTVADGWEALDETAYPGVYYRVVEKDSDNTDVTYPIIKDDSVTVKETVTKEQLNELDANGAKNYPKLTITAYAVQYDTEIEAIDTAAEAWDLVLGEQSTATP